MERSLNPPLLAYFVGRVVEEVTRRGQAPLDLTMLHARVRQTVLDHLALGPTVTDFLVELAARDVQEWLRDGGSAPRWHALAAD